MPLHTGFHPTCAVAFCPLYDTTRKNFASKVQWSSWGGKIFWLTYFWNGVKNKKIWNQSCHKICGNMERRLKNCGSHC